jgi:uncharacterized membrane protein YeiH
VESSFGKMISQNAQLAGAVLVAALASMIYIRSIPTLGKIIQFNEFMEGYAFSLNKYTPSISALDLAGSILSCKGYRQNIKSNKSWFESLVACTLMQFGGTTLTGLLLGQTPSWILSNTAFPALILAWWLTFFCPLDLYWKFLNKTPGLLFFIGIWAAVSAGHAVTSWGFDKAAFNASHVNVLRISQSVLTCIGCGTLSGCGGGLLCDWLGFLRTKNPFTPTTTPSILVTGRYSSSATINRCFWLAVLYFVLLNHHKVFPWSYQSNKDLGHLIIVALQVANYILQTVSPTIDVFQSLSTFVLSNVFLITPEVGPERVAPETEDGGDDEKEKIPAAAPARSPGRPAGKKSTAATEEKRGRSGTPASRRRSSSVAKKNE